MKPELCALGNSAALALPGELLQLASGLARPALHHADAQLTAGSTNATWLSFASSDDMQCLAQPTRRSFFMIALRHRDALHAVAETLLNHAHVAEISFIKPCAPRWQPGRCPTWRDRRDCPLDHAAASAAAA